MTIHPTGIGRLSARHAIDDLSLIDIDMLQTPHGEQGAVVPTVHTVRDSYADKPILPVIDGEASYEMLGDRIPTRWTREMFWLCMTNGAAGHTYGANGIWQCNRRGQPHGPSPTAGSPPTGYGVIPWDDAMNLPGSGQVGLGKKFFEQFPWQKFQPHPEWAGYVHKSQVSLDSCQWIWFPEGNPALDAPAGKRFFRRFFELPEGKTVKSAEMRLSADDRFSARLNGKPIGTSGDGAESWRDAKQLDDLAALLHPGRNLLAIEAENLPAPGPNPAGLICRLDVRFSDGQLTSVISDDTWRALSSAAAGWDTPGFDEANCLRAMKVAQYGQGPWGNLDAPRDDKFLGPQSSGIPGVARVIYVPDARAIEAKQLDKNATYSASLFDPVTAQTESLPEVRGDAEARWICPPPAGQNHDWVVILQKRR